MNTMNSLFQNHLTSIWRKQIWKKSQHLTILLREPTRRSNIIGTFQKKIRDPSGANSLHYNLFACREDKTNNPVQAVYRIRQRRSTLLLNWSRHTTNGKLQRPAQREWPANQSEAQSDSSDSNQAVGSFLPIQTTSQNRRLKTKRGYPAKEKLFKKRGKDSAKYKLRIKSNNTIVFEKTCHQSQK